MRYPNAPARPIFSKALALTTVSTMALIVSAAGSTTALAACDGTLVAPKSTGITIQCSDATTPTSGNVTVAPADTTNYKDTGSYPGTNGNNVLLQFDGQGRTLKVGAGAEVSNERTYTGTTGGRNRTAVLMGASTQNASATTTFASDGAPVAGGTVVKLNSVTPATSWVGQTLVFGRFDAADGDFLAGKGVKILSVDTVNKTVTLSGPIPSDFAGTGDAGLPIVFSVISNYGNGSKVDGVFYNNVVNNAGTISAKIGLNEINTNKNGATSVSNTGQVKAITTSVRGDYLVVNQSSGTIRATHDGLGLAYAIEAGGQVTSLTVQNAQGGVIEAKRTPHVTLNTGIAASTVATGTGTTFMTATSPELTAAPYALTTAVALAQVNAINNQEELEVFNLENSGTIRAVGDYSAAIVSRAGEDIIVNSGLIEHLNTDGGYTKGYAIGANGNNDGSVRSMELTNEETGIIHGDILAVNAQSLRWYLLSTEYTGANVDQRLNINSQHGQFNSEIENAGTIIGNFWYSNGTHVLVNEEDATITGNIDVDQRDTKVVVGTGIPVGPNITTTVFVVEDEETGETTKTNNTFVTDGTNGLYTYRGTKEFTFENAGLFTGKITVRTATSTDLTNNINVSSSVIIKTHVFGEGTDDDLALIDNSRSGYINGELKVWDGTNSTFHSTTTIAPVIDSLVRNEERYTVATSVFQAGASLPDLPEVEGSALVSWEAGIGTGVNAGKLFIEATVADASTISGLSAPGVAALNGLMNLNTENEEALAFAGAIQNLSAGDARTAGEQLAPDTSRATTNATNQLASLYSNAIGQRLTGGLNGTGSTGGTGFAPPSGLGMGSGDTSRFEAPMRLSSRDESGYAAAPGREAAWAQAFGAKLNQDAVATTGAYDADLYGFMGGYDGSLSQNFRAGVAFGYGNTSINETGVRQGNATEIESYNATAYAAARGANWYLTGQLGYTSHDFLTQRRLSAGGVTANANGSHDGDQFTAAGELGAPIRMAGAIVTPVASLAYNKLDQDGYTERGTAGFAQAVANQSSTSLVSGLGVRTALAIGAGTALEARAIWLHEFDDTNQTVTATFASASNAFTSTGASLSADSANLGAGLNMNSGTGYALQLNYDAYVSDDFIAHAGTGRVRVEF